MDLDTYSAASPPCQEDTLVEMALKILHQASPWRKADFSDIACDLWLSRKVTAISRPGSPLRAPDRPARDDSIRLVDPSDAPKRGKGGSLKSRQVTLHALCHTESWAVDLFWDLVARFGCDPSYPLPAAFFDDIVQGAGEECKHFRLLANRLEALGAKYGDFDAHDGLWESAERTAHSLPARLAVEHCVHEGRGIDRLPQTAERFRSNGDTETYDLLTQVIYADEIGHCAAGVRWLKYLHKLAHDPGAEGPGGEREGGVGNNQTDEAKNGAMTEGQEGTKEAVVEGEGGEVAQKADSGEQGAAKESHVPAWVADARKFASVEKWFHHLVKGHFFGALKPPFNTEARERAGFTPEWYEPLCDKDYVPEPDVV